MHIHLIISFYHLYNPSLSLRLYLSLCLPYSDSMPLCLCLFLQRLFCLSPSSSLCFLQHREDEHARIFACNTEQTNEILKLRRLLQDSRTPLPSPAPKTATNCQPGGDVGLEGAKGQAVGTGAGREEVEESGRVSHREGVLVPACYEHFVRDLVALPTLREEDGRLQSLGDCSLRRGG